MAQPGVSLSGLAPGGHNEADADADAALSKGPGGKTLPCFFPSKPVGCRKCSLASKFLTFTSQADARSRRRWRGEVGIFPSSIVLGFQLHRSRCLQRVQKFPARQIVPPRSERDLFVGSLFQLQRASRTFRVASKKPRYCFTFASAAAAIVGAVSSQQRYRSSFSAPSAPGALSSSALRVPKLTVWPMIQGLSMPSDRESPVAIPNAVEVWIVQSFV
ncbi:hypothetical protein L1887_47813 [Cichorium endivia]|nr:hypothetical protein L1887_47813 [Cichorium endivia]